MFMQIKEKMLTEHRVQGELSELAKESWCRQRGKVSQNITKGNIGKVRS